MKELFTAFLFQQSWSFSSKNWEKSPLISLNKNRTLHKNGKKTFFGSSRGIFLGDKNIKESFFKFWDVRKKRVNAWSLAFFLGKRQH